MGTDAQEPLEPDAVILSGEGQEGRNVNADKAYPGLQSVNVRGLKRRYRRGGGRGGAAQQAGKQREERSPKR
ncbi:hypothetical protein [Kribbella sp. C-35]|uniref:hypothetical protein n=1 Tax=Kribbella sp. C-35 TaxID=2789276 RepID=UPI003977ECE1